MSRASLVTPIGTLHVSAEGGVLTRVDIGAGSQRADGDRLMVEALAQLAAWFEGRLAKFDLPLAVPVTPRGLAHRAGIAAIGYGQTASYGAVARAVGSAPRAVGQACRRNPFPLIVPCHRVVGSGGALGHYSAGAGVSTKRWLLEFEERMNLRWAA